MRNRRNLRIFGIVVILLNSILPLGAFAQATLNIDSLLSAARTKYDLPALGAAVILDGKLQQIAVTGVRKYGDTTRATIDDKWHLGSDTKAMTATLIGKLVEMGKLRWDTKIVDVFPELSAGMDPAFRAVTLEMLLCHRAGLPTESWPKGMTLDSVRNFPGTPVEQRYLFTKLMLASKPVAEPGTKFIYANAGFSIAGAMAERVMKRPYEDLMNEYIFKPLSITSAGYGSMNTAGKIDEPWEHIVDEKMQHIPIDSSVNSDNPEAITPAGRVHMSLADWSKFAIAHLLGEEQGGLLLPATFKHLHSLPFDGDYGFGWLIVKRSWANGMALTHDGSNQLNYASIWLAPKRKFGVLVVTNEGGDSAQKACSEFVSDVVIALFIH